MSEMERELQILNTSNSEILRDEFSKCCGSPAWVEEMMQSTPFRSCSALFELGNLIWWNLSKEEWLKAFGAHPKIGDREALRAKFNKPNSWEGNEQSGTNSASEEVLEALEVLNNEYELRHGFIFIICATGKSANEMLQALQSRINNDTDTERQNAALEQSKIIQLRLVKMLQSFAPNESLHSKL